MKQKNVIVDITTSDSEAILNNLVQQMNKTSSYFCRPKRNNLIHPDDGGDSPNRRTIVHTDDRMSSVSSSIKLKYYLQWFLVIFIHFVLFWYLPSKSNNASQSHFYCDSQSGSTVRCNEVSDNIFLICFYLLN